MSGTYHLRAADGERRLLHRLRKKAPPGGPDFRASEELRDSVKVIVVLLLFVVVFSGKLGGCGCSRSY